MPAKTWDSYKPTLLRVLDEFRPRYVLEFGAGFSTDLIATHASVERVESLEHDQEYYERLLAKYHGNVRFIYEPDLDAYAQYKPAFTPDFVFVDGRNRARCLREVRSCSKVVMLHDAARETYQEAVEEYPFKVWTDDGNTASLTQDPEIYRRLMKCLEKLLFTSRI